MARSEIETVLANWIGQALSSLGQLPQDADPAQWVASRFAEWWRMRAEESLTDAEVAASAIQDELSRLGGWEACGEALHEHSHLQNALADLRTILELARD